MSLGIPDALGIGRYAESTARGPFSTVLNLGLQAVSDAIAALFSAPVAFTPTWTNFTLGNGTQAWYYQKIRGRVKVWGIVTLGSTSAVGTSPYFAVPIAGSFVSGEILGRCIMDDSGNRYHGPIHYEGSVSAPLPRRFLVSGTNIIDSTIAATAPFTWATGDKLSMQYEYRAA